MARQRQVGTGKLEDKAPSSESSPGSSGGGLPWLRVLFRLLFFMYYATVHAGEYLYVNIGLSRNNGTDNPFMKNPYAGRWKYLTSLNLSLQLVYFFVALSTDLIPRNWAQRKIRRLADYVFTTLAFPFTMSVTVAFWSIYWYNRELIYPEAIDKVIHPIVNHIIHTFILPIAIAEVALVRHGYPSNRRAALTIFIAHAMYTLWVLWIHYHTGKWVYRYMQKNSSFTFIALLPLRTFGTLIFYFIGKTISDFVWG